MLNQSPLNSGPLNSSMAGSDPAEPVEPIDIGPQGPIDPENPPAPPAPGQSAGHIWSATVSGHSADLTGVVSVQHPDQGNAVAEFSYYSPGTLPAVGDAVQIHFDGVLRFAGAVDEAEYSSETGIVTCRAATDLEALIGAMTKEQVELLIGGFWSEDVFGPLDERDSWQYAQERLTTRPVGLGVERDGTPRIVPLVGPADGGWRFIAGSLFDATLNGIRLTPAEGVTGAEVEIDYRYSERMQRTQSYTWTSVSGRGTSGFEQYHFNRSHQLPDEAMLLQAIGSSGWRLSSLQTTKLPPSNPAIRWVNNLSLDLMLSADFSIRTRWVQRRIERYKINLGDDSGRVQRLRAVIDVPVEEDAEGWESSITGSPGFARDEQRLSEAAACLLAQAQTALGEARPQARYSFESPLVHCLGIDGGDRIQIDDAGLQAAGVASMVVDEIDIETGAAVSLITFEDRAANTVPVPSLPLPPAEFPDWPEPPGQITLGNQMGDLETDPESYDPDLPGFAGNYTFTTIQPGTPDPGEEPEPYIANGVYSAYPRRFLINTPEIPEEQRNERVAEVTL